MEDVSENSDRGDAEEGLLETVRSEEPAAVPQADGSSEPPGVEEKPEDPAARLEPTGSEATGGEASGDERAATGETGAATADPRGKPRREKKPEGEKKWRREPGLALSFRKGLPVEGKIEQVIRGGYEVRVGSARGFCPHSQLDLQHVENPEEHVGKVYPFRVIQIRRGGEEVVLSRRALLEEGRAEEAKAVRATLIEGQITQGHVARLADFGAFVDLGAGVTGLVHVSEVARTRIERPGDVLKPGDLVRVKVLGLASGTGRISLSIRQALSDPWAHVAERYHPGDVVSGKIQRVADFGAFVELEDGLEVLAPADAFAPRSDGWQSGTTIGEAARWRIVSVDLQRRRVAVQPEVEGDTGAQPTLETGANTQGRVQRVEKFGVFVWLRPGLVGLMPNVHTGTKKGSDLARAFPIGTELTVEVTEVDPEGRRVRLAVPGAATAAATEPRRAQPSGPPRDRPRMSGNPPGQREKESTAVGGPAFGTNLGDALRAAFGRKPDGD